MPYTPADGPLVIQLPRRFPCDVPATRRSRPCPAGRAAGGVALAHSTIVERVNAAQDETIPLKGVRQ